MVMEPGFAIGQRAFAIPDAGGLVMWECLSIVTDEALERLASMGGVTAIAISHPHFYGTMVDWSDALGGVPIYLHAADREWVQRPSDNIRFWEGDRFQLSEKLELIHLPGHFAGSAGLWWKDGPRAGGCLFPGDAIQVTMDRRYTSFMYSYPNAIPLSSRALDKLASKVEPLAFEDVYGFAPGRQIIGDGKGRIAASFARYHQAIAA
jgi:glyoxylase-like metal-dependent hydrolase (beta-lactamase superfamily II)